ncbi:multidrug resistance protein homolog 49-like isoform X2 [Culicoides brevitarsis]|uniref:multidrug resistance protein homolog 49-like isoform X2 n=1 Tax=Culicoides brevitarsis TaxID=469753 RepID=UPI00307B9EC7
MVNFKRKNVLTASFRSLKKTFSNGTILPFHELFMFATPLELALVIVGIIFSVLSALGIPVVIVLYGEYTTILIDRVREAEISTETLILKWFGGGRILINATTEENRAEMIVDARAYALSNVVVFIFQLITMAIGIYLFNFSGQKQICTIKKLFFKSVLRQDQTWFDLNQNESFAVKFNDDLEKIKEGISEKVSIFIYSVGTFFFSIIFAFIYGWKLTLVILSVSPLIILSTAYVAKMQTTLTEKERKSYSSAGGIAEEVLNAIRTVFAFNGQQQEVARYNEHLGIAEKNGIRKGMFTGAGGGVTWLIIYLVYALAFWYGMQLILEDRYKEVKEYTPAALLIVLFGVLTGAQNMGLTLPHLESFNVARAAATGVYAIIGRKSEIDAMSEKGCKPSALKGDFKLTNVHFHYPSRKDVKVLKGLNLTMRSGQTTALVGMSGCGKSTVLQLIQRLYDPKEGIVEVDGIPLKTINVSHLRSFIGVVGQEPVLFDTTILENIRYGFPEATREQVEKAAKIATCHKFISKFPDGYETKVGQNGAQLSGGQKQRIAIARAIIKNPSILLLDEATSALDPTSEREVQNALEKASEGRTTIVISHRLSTIVNADKIVVIDKGVVVEEGKHSELMEIKGIYHNLVLATSNKKQEETDEEKNDDFSAQNDFKSLTSLDLSQKSLDYRHANSNEEEDYSSDVKDDSHKVPLRRLLGLNAPEWPFLLLGSVSAVIVGASFPIFAVLFGGIYGLLGGTDDIAIQEGTNFYSIMFIVLGIVTGIATFLQSYAFNVAGARLTKRLRFLSFEAMINQSVAWYDEPTNTVGELSSRLSSDCAQVEGALGTRMGYIFQCVSIIIIGVALAFYYSWKLTLVSIVALPITLAVVFIESKLMTSSEIKEKKSTEQATKLAVEAISNIKTIASLGQEKLILQKYELIINDVTRTCIKKIRYRGPVYAVGQTIPMLGYALALWYGGILVSRFEMRFDEVVKVSEALLFGAWMMGQALAFAPNVNSAMKSAKRVLDLLDSRKAIEIIHDKRWQQSKWIAEGDITYEGAKFSYPLRPKVEVLQGLDLKIFKGQTVALVGPSGCGKSTCIQLLLRYYDLKEGKIWIDDRLANALPAKIVRNQIGLVSQEPTLFDRSIAENIAYGDDSDQLSMEDIIKASKMANIHDFIIRLPQGYDTNLGAKGSQLSGGQKQRIAIARALIRNPRILLLDEATSALDNQSQKVVQEALDQAREGRTCITIAHRLSTIENADVICVVKEGKVVEQGSHNELLALGGAYKKLYEMQKI